MSKTFLYRFFGLGKLPASVLAPLEKEGIVLLDEGIRATVTYRNFRAPGKYSNWKRQWFSAAIILTKQRLLAFRLRSEIINVHFTDERFRQMQFSLEEAETLLVAFDASLFQVDWSGMIEYRFKIEQARDFFDKIQTVLKPLQNSGNTK
jgi:hypothetical protein